MYLIYKRTTPDGKVYIGCTSSSLEGRAGAGGSGYKQSSRFWKAIQNFGWNSIVTDILEELSDRSSAATRERYWIDYYKALDPEFGYNGIPVAYHCSSKSLSRLATSVKASLADPEVKKRHVAGLKLAMNQPEVKERLRRVAIAQWSKPEFRQKHAEATRNAVNQPEVKAKVSASSKAMWADPEFKARRKEQMNDAAYKEKRRQLQSGRVHVTDGTINRMVSKTEAETLTATQGWRYGWVPKKP